MSAIPAGEIDLVVVGAGSAGFAAALRASELGARVALVERGRLGGTCVNVGCVPSKTLLRAAEVRHRAERPAFRGVAVGATGPVDLRAVVEQKRELVAGLQRAKYEDVLAGQANVRLLRGEARLTRAGDALGVEVDGRLVRARRVVLATGSSAWLPPIPGLAEARPLTSTELMELEELPPRLVVLGGGYVGLELGQAFARLGARLTVLARSRLVRREDEELAAGLADELRAEGLDVRTGVSVERVTGGPGRFRLELAPGGAIEAEQLLVATGRRPSTAGLGLADAGVRMGPSGEVLVDEHLQTSRPGVFAAGDVTGEPAFVYVAAYAGRLAAGNALGCERERERYDVSVVPRVVFTDPAIASVGPTEAEARQAGARVAVSRLPMSLVPRAIAARDTRGLVKLVADAESRRLLGAHVLASEAGDVIQEAALAIRFGIRVDEIASMLHPYLTRAEALKLACQAFEKDVTKLSCCAA